jgi:hypothetical protein
MPTTSLLDDLRRELRPKMWQKCYRLTWKTEGERFTMYVTSNCRMERVCIFCHDELNIRPTAATSVPWMLNNGQKEQRITALSSVLSSKNRPKTTPISFPPSIVVMILGFTDTTLRRSSNHLSGRRQIHRDPRKQTGSKQCQINVDLFPSH